MSGIVFITDYFLRMFTIYSFFDKLSAPVLQIAQSVSSPQTDFSVEGMRSQQFSEGVFIFMLVTILVFSAIVYAVVFGKYAPKNVRTGEKIMFGAIILGIIAAIVIGALQMLSGFLF